LNTESALALAPGAVPCKLQVASRRSYRVSQRSLHIRLQTPPDQPEPKD